MTREHSLRYATPIRARLWSDLMGRIDAYLDGIDNQPIGAEPDVARLRDALGRFDFAQPVALGALLDFVTEGLGQQVHTSHPRYFGLFNPAPTTMGIAADVLVAAFNPQMAAWSHAPFANEVERHLVRTLAAGFGYDSDAADGTFCSGGAEANHTALLAALTHRFADFAEGGARALPAQPLVYVSSQSHHSFVKAARFCGIGTHALREVAVTDDLKMDPADLAAQVRADLAAGGAPCLVVATGGTTNAGVVDPIGALVEVAEQYDLWCHLDAAWGGAAALVPELHSVLAGCERTDSITFDAHKWMSVPMAAGLFLTRHRDILARTCAVSTEYMPKDAARFAVEDPYARSLQWSRRFIGLKVFMSLAAAGYSGYADALGRQVAMGDRLRKQLRGGGWRIENDTPLPVVCFAHPQVPRRHYEAIAHKLMTSGQAWISTTRLRGEAPVLRACITNFLTDEGDVAALVAALDDVVAGYGQ